jgi:hypothetical protein
MHSDLLDSDDLPQIAIKNDSIVIRGGDCTAENFIKGNLGPLNHGKLTCVSVNCSLVKAAISDKDVDKYRQSIPNQTVGVTRYKSIKEQGGKLIYEPLQDNPYHCRLYGITPTTAAELFRQNLFYFGAEERGDAVRRIYLDLQARDYQGRIQLDRYGTTRDLVHQGITLHEGMALSFYTDDANHAGESVDILTEGVVHRDPDSGIWFTDVE